MRKITREQVHSDNKETKGKRQTDGKAAKRCKVKKQCKQMDKTGERKEKMNQ